MAVWAIVKKSEAQKTARLDAEYYQPRYFTLLNQLRQSGLPLNRLSDLITERVHRGTLPKYTENHEIPVIKTGVVRNDFLLFDSCAYTTGDFYAHNPRGVVKPLDILMTSTGRGTLGRVNIFNENFKAYADGHISIIRTSKVDPYYMYAFLVSKYGQFQAEMAYVGSTGQIEIYPDHIEAFTIPIPSAEHEKYIRRLAYEAHSLKRQSERLYLQAEQMLLAELSLDKLDFSQPNHYSIPLSQAQGLRRVDAEHFQPKYGKLTQRLKKRGKTKQIGEFLAEPIQKGVTPQYEPDGDVIVINSQHLGRYSLNFEATDRTTYNFWRENKKAQIKYLDVMIYATGAYVGRTNCYLEKHNAFAGVDILLVRPNYSCNPLYLAVYLNTISGIWQAEKFASGSGQRHIYPHDVAQFIASLPSEGFQTKIADLVTQSYQARQKAKSLLEEAKKEVEGFIKKEGCN